MPAPEPSRSEEKLLGNLLILFFSPTPTATLPTPPLFFQSDMSLILKAHINSIESELNALVDSSTPENFIDQVFMTQYNLITMPLKKPLHLVLFDRHDLLGGKVTQRLTTSIQFS